MLKSILTVAACVLTACGSSAVAPVAPLASAAPRATSTPIAAGAPPAAAFPVPETIRSIVDATDRDPADRALDPGRHPGELLAFFGIRPGMKVAELVSGGGYTTELLARAVGANGAVYGMNTPAILKNFAEKAWAERLTKPVMKNVVRVDREIEDPLPPEARDLDAVFLVLYYHDTVRDEVDRGKMNASVFRALRSGGIYAIVDHSGRAGVDAKDTGALHRVQEEVVRSEIEHAGFNLLDEASFLRNPADGRDWNDSPKAAAEKRGTSDRFVLKFQKP